jgi:hypothetical protein
MRRERIKTFFRLHFTILTILAYHDHALHLLAELPFYFNVL